ncbi:MAG TPA: hypothetical protein VEX86_27515 [Longimicrobium sp.]|nr:hypothetical protein [Longimicrobium sp.]
MNKLTLAVEELKVDSFETEEQGAARGTVAGHALSGFTCVNCETWLRCPTILTRDCCTP